MHSYSIEANCKIKPANPKETSGYFKELNASAFGRGSAFVWLLCVNLYVYNRERDVAM